MALGDTGRLGPQVTAPEAQSAGRGPRRLGRTPLCHSATASASHRLFDSVILSFFVRNNNRHNHRPPSFGYLEG